MRCAIVGIRNLTEHVKEIHLRPTEASVPSFHAGQYLKIVHPSGHEIPYSIANAPAADMLELHYQPIEATDDARFMDELLKGSELTVELPFGHCFVDVTRFGRSRARYEGNTLIIESSHMLGNPTGTGGNWLSDQTTIVETYRRDDDPEQGPMVAMEMIIEDPGHLTEAWEMLWKKLYMEDYQFIAVECHTPLQPLANTVDSKAVSVE